MGTNPSSLIRLLALLLLLGGPAAADAPKEDQAAPIKTETLKGVELKKISGGPYFLTDIAEPADGKNRLFLTTQKGKIYTFDMAKNVVNGPLFMDLTSRVVMKYDMGLLAIAFHPSWTRNRKFYVFYSGKGKTKTGHGYVARISEFTANNTLTKGDPKSEKVLIEFPTHVACRRGGALVFGPDSNLYIGVGDSAGKDMKGAASGMTAQDRNTIYGSILRINVDQPGKGGKPYSIPAGNPFVGGKAPEIYAYGLRNPWRISFDPKNRALWCADNGEDTREEINLIGQGKNYGWPWREGKIAFPGMTEAEKAAAPKPKEFREPIWDYLNAPPRSKAYAIIGGHVYRGRDVPALEGVYVFAEHGQRAVYGIKYNYQKKQVTASYLIKKMPYAPTSFCRDTAGELWMVTYAPSAIYKFVAAGGGGEKK